MSTSPYLYLEMFSEGSDNDLQGQVDSPVSYGGMERSLQGQVDIPVSYGGMERSLHDFPSSERSEIFGDRRNEFYSLKRFILISLGIPRAPAMNSSYQRVCSKSFIGARASPTLIKEGGGWISDMWYI